MLNSDQFLQANTSFRDGYFKKNKKKLSDLVKHGQHPKALFIGCADSRFVPNLITKCAPGDLFILRNVGNFVAPYNPKNELHPTGSAIEYAINVLEIKEIIVCGHTHCGAISSLYKNIDDPNLIHTKNWLSLGIKAKDEAIKTLGEKTCENEEKLYRLTEKLSVLSQTQNLLTFPSVKKKFDEKIVNINSWIYDIENGQISFYDFKDSTFKELK